MKKKIVGKVFLGTVEVAGYYRNLALGFDSLGIQCTYFTYKPHPFGYVNQAYRPTLLVLADFIDKIRNYKRCPVLFRMLLGGPSFMLWFIWVLKTILGHDLFIFGYGRTFTAKFKWDLWLIRKLGKKIIVNMGHGSESRPPYLDGSRQDPYGTRILSPEQLVDMSYKMSLSLKNFFNYTDLIVGAPYSTSFFSQNNLINWFSLGVPCTPMPENPPREVIDSFKPVKILHSPSHPALKGTPEIYAAVDRLVQKGYKIELVMLTGRPHSEVMTELEECDFVVDQIYSDTPMAGFAAEAATLGKACVVGGYGLEELKAFVPEDMWPPTKICSPEFIQDAIEELILNRDYRIRLGEDARAFVSFKWDAAEVAKRYLALASGDFPCDWWFDPKEVSYLYGCGQSKERTIESLKSILDEVGKGGLQLAHRPDLEQSFVSMVDSLSPENITRVALD